jgi:hypothetical protein
MVAGVQHPGGDGGGHVEARIARLEAHVGEIRRDVREIKDDLKEIRSDARVDFRRLFGALIAVAIGLAGLMARGFGWLG